jgi:hypothetical protein
MMNEIIIVKAVVTAVAPGKKMMQFSQNNMIFEIKL